MPIDEVGKVCIVGAGTMGHRIALMCAIHGYDTAVYDISEEALQQALTRQKKTAEQMVAWGAFSQSEVDAGMTRITYTTDPGQAAENADLLSESVPEVVDLKRQIHAQFDQLCPPHAILTTNTSSLLVSDIESAVRRGDKFAAMHFHGGLRSLVDIMRGPRTSPETVDTLKRFARSLGEVPMVMKKEKGGYLFNTILGAILQAALSLVAGGYADVEDVDRAYMLVTRNPAGPFGMIDGVGLDVILDAGQSLSGQGEAVNPQQLQDFLRPYFERGDLGLKTGKGFYTYPNPAFQQPDFLTGQEG